MSSSPLSPLVFLHPNGFVQRALVIGENAPARLSVTCDSVNNEQPVDFILWAPSATECQIPGGLRSTSERIRTFLARDGLVYALIPTRWRVQAQRDLRREGLEIELAMAHLPDWSSSRYCIPLESGPIEYTFTRQFPTNALKRIAALAALRWSSGRRLIGYGYPSAAFVARLPHSQRLFLWLYQKAGISPQTSCASMAIQWKGEHCSVVIHGYAEGSEPKIVAKTIVIENGQYELGNEYRILENLGPAARQSGAKVPQPLLSVPLGDCPVFLQSFLPGTCAAPALAGHPERIGPTIERITTWLTAWNQATAVQHSLDEPWITRTFLAPLEVILPHMADCAAYRDWLLSCCAEFQNPVKFVAVHNDLTLWNILLQPDGSIGVVDWREAQPAALPLGDFFYLFIDVVSVAHRYKPDKAFLECVRPLGRYHSLLQATLRRMQKILDLPAPLVNLSLHACFLHHAANEQHERQSDEDHPFLRILCWLEKNRLALEQEMQ